MSVERVQTVASRVYAEPEPTKGSRFLVSVSPVSSEPAARDFLAEVAAERPDASHHCWAWRIAAPAIDRAGDDGEPRGSAGRPILAQLIGRDLVDTAVIVTRYFGGTKLGVGGLVRAYGAAAAAGLDRAERIDWQRWVAATIVHNHADANAVKRAMETCGATDTDVHYAEVVTRRIQVPESAVTDLASQLAGATSGRSSLVPPNSDNR